MTTPIPTPNVAASAAKPARTGTDYLALLIATCGVGYLPIAPGTWGSAVGVVLYLLICNLFLRFSTQLMGIEQMVFTLVLLIFIFIITGLGIWAGTRTEKISGRKDPGIVVIDEVAGQLITFLFVVPLRDYRAMLAGFLLFRLFDIFKPYPIRRLEGLGGGLGIMADDVLAGLYAATTMLILSLLMVYFFCC
jgi:phosphatidylglycerophosphatase A